MTTLGIVIPTVGRDSLERAVRSADRCADQTVVVADQCMVDAHYGAVLADVGCPGFARNVGAEHVWTEWLGFCDDDDQLVPDLYRQAVERHPAVDMIVHTAWHPELGPIPRPGWPLEHGNVTIAFTVKTKAFREEGGFIAGPPRTFRGEDYEMVRRFIDNGRIVVLSPPVAYLIRPEENPRP